MENEVDKYLSILEDEIFDTPYQQLDNKVDFLEFISTKLDFYLEYITPKINDFIDDKNWEREKPDISNRIEKLCKCIIKTLSNYLNGNILTALKNFYSGLDDISFYKENSNIANLVEIPENSQFYRIRKSDGDFFTKEQMFHIPFDKRHLIATQRYSIPGIPSLYLGDSIFICWSELDKPSIREFYASRLQNTKSLKVIALTRKDDVVKQLSNTNGDWLFTVFLRYIVTFPLIAACSIKTKFPKGAFKVEYILPQMLLQYVAENKEIDGIKYFSTKIEYEKLNDFPCSNFVFPPKQNKANGYCDNLTKRFLITEATSLEMEEIKYNPKYQTGIYLGSDTNDNRKLEITKGEITYYHQTVFNRLEQALSLFKENNID